MLVALIGAAAIAGGIALMLHGIWLGVIFILIAAVLIAVPAALCATEFLCGRLYGPRADAPRESPPELMDASTESHHTRECSNCQIVRAWITSAFHGSHQPFWELIGMRERGTPPHIVVNAYVMMKRDGLVVSIASLEDLYITEQARIHDAFDLVHVATGLKD